PRPGSRPPSSTPSRSPRRRCSPPSPARSISTPPVACAVPATSRRPMLHDLASLARERADAHLGLGAFNVIHLEHAEAFVRAAERAEQPVVLQVSQNAVSFHGALAPLARAVLTIADAAAVPVVVHLDHAED